MQLSDSQIMQISPSQILSDFRTYLQATICMDENLLVLTSKFLTTRPIIDVF